MVETASGLVARIEAARGQAVKLTIFRLPPDLKTIVAVTPGALESFPGVQIDTVDDPATIGAALDAIAASQPIPSARPIDARFGLVFSDAADERVLSAYKGSFATRGQIDRQPCDYDELALHEWLVSRYPSAPRGG